MLRLRLRGTKQTVDVRLSGVRGTITDLRYRLTATSREQHRARPTFTWIIAVLVYIIVTLLVHSHVNEPNNKNAFQLKEDHPRAGNTEYRQYTQTRFLLPRP